ncbi:MAG: hypothetical protein ACRC0F_09770, partial [Cetobacterium sp.]
MTNIIMIVLIFIILGSLIFTVLNIIKKLVAIEKKLKENNSKILVIEKNNLKLEELKFIDNNMKKLKEELYEFNFKIEKLEKSKEEQEDVIRKLYEL